MRRLVLRDDGGVDAAAHVELGADAHEPGVHGRHQVVEDAIGNGLVEGSLVAEGPDVELQRL